jgi:hypothetical protein
VPDIDWTTLALFVAAVVLAALYGLSASGHFPSEYRAGKLRGSLGGLVLWGTMAVSIAATAAVLAMAWRALPWYATVIGGGAALLFAPLLLQPLPDSFVNGRRGLVVFAAGALILAALMWRAASAGLTLL